MFGAVLFYGSAGTLALLALPHGFRVGFVEGWPMVLGSVGRGVQLAHCCKIIAGGVGESVYKFGVN